MANGRPYFSFVSKRSNDITQDEVERNLRRRLHNAESIFIDENDKAVVPIFFINSDIG